MGKLSCIGSDGGTRPFDYSFQKDMFSNEWQFKVTTVAAQPDGAFFDFKADEIDPQTVRIVMMHHYDNPAYRAMGIPDALIPEVKMVLGMGVESSPTIDPTNPAIYRTPPATKVWKRLEARRLAVFDASRDVYRLL